MDWNNVSYSLWENQRNYDGDLISPNTVDIVVKKDQTFYSHTISSLNTQKACIPIYGSILAIKKIIIATKIIFQELSKDSPKTELKNAFKNLGRGFIELFPIISLFLLVYDNLQDRQRLPQIRQRILKLEQDLRLEDAIAKIFVNGQLAETIPLRALDVDQDSEFHTGNECLEFLTTQSRHYLKGLKEGNKLTLLTDYLNGLRHQLENDEMDPDY